MEATNTEPNLAPKQALLFRNSCSSEHLLSSCISLTCFSRAKEVERGVGPRFLTDIFRDRWTSCPGAEDRHFQLALLGNHQRPKRPLNDPNQVSKLPTVENGGEREKWQNSPSNPFASEIVPQFPHRSARTPEKIVAESAIHNVPQRPASTSQRQFKNRILPLRDYGRASHNPIACLLCLSPLRKIPAKRKGERF